MNAARMEQFGFNPVKNLFPEMQCRICDARNPIAFFAPKPSSGRAGAIWHCVCFDCARDKLHWLDAQGALRPGVTV